MAGIGDDYRLVTRRTMRIIVRRWRLIGSLALALVGANLIQALNAGPDLLGLPALAAAMTILFLIGRLTVLVLLHIVGVRLAADVDAPARAVARLDARQAVWFHGLILIWIVGLSFRFGLGAPLMRATVRAGAHPLMADILVTGAYLLLLFLLVVRLQPGFVGVMLGDPHASARWAFQVSRAHVPRVFAIAAVLGMPFLLLRQTFAFAFAGQTLTVALADGLVSTVMMLMPSVTYHRIYEHITGHA